MAAGHILTRPSADPRAEVDTSCSLCERTFVNNQQGLLAMPCSQQADGSDKLSLPSRGQSQLEECPHTHQNCEICADAELRNLGSCCAFSISCFPLARFDWTCLFTPAHLPLHDDQGSSAYALKNRNLFSTCCPQPCKGRAPLGHTPAGSRWSDTAPQQS